ncbi:MAG: hypothetical protein ACTS41_01505 [Candidatus Hodgkinia cicadicola]
MDERKHGRTKYKTVKLERFMFIRKHLNNRWIFNDFRSKVPIERLNVLYHFITKVTLINY